jgi:hypothetical protein
MITKSVTSLSISNMTGHNRLARSWYDSPIKSVFKISQADHKLRSEEPLGHAYGTSDVKVRRTGGRTRGEDTGRDGTPRVSMMIRIAFPWTDFFRPSVEDLFWGETVAVAWVELD